MPQVALSISLWFFWNSAFERRTPSCMVFPDGVSILYFSVPEVFLKLISKANGSWPEETIIFEEKAVPFTLENSRGRFEASGDSTFAVQPASKITAARQKTTNDIFLIVPMILRKRVNVNYFHKQVIIGKFLRCVFYSQQSIIYFLFPTRKLTNVNYLL